jgi:hypothetical protein
MRRALFAQGAASLVVAVTLLALAAVGSANHSAIERVSTGPLSDNGAFEARFAGATPDGTRAFIETAEPLQEGDFDTSVDVYERSGGTTTQISIGTGHFDAHFVGVSSDGTRVFFTTAQRLEAGDTDSSIDIYQRFGATTTRISTGPTGGNGAFGAFFEGASEDGTRVFFSTSESLVAGDTDTASDIYERSGGTTTLISVSPANGPFSATFEDASADGTRVFFKTYESLHPADLDSNNGDIYERFGGTTNWVSTGPVGGSGAGFVNDVFFGDASTDGTRVFFTTEESLTADDMDNGLCLDGRGCSDVYERSGGTTTRISTGSTGGNGAFGASFEGISWDGTRVFIRTNERLEVGDTDNATDVYERSGGTTTRISTGSTGGNGDFTAYFSEASADGTRVFFSTSESLEPDDTDTYLDVYERFGGTTTRITTGPSGGNGDFYLQFTSGISADGTRVFLETEEPLDPGDTDACQFQRACFDVYERFGGTTTRISTGPAGGNGSINAHLPRSTFRYPRYPGAVSADGTRVFFETYESLTADDTDGNTDVYAAAVNAYPRPKAATPLRVSLVPAYTQCTAGNRTHGPPLAFASCNPPTQQSSRLTVGTPDANGAAADSAGYARYRVIVGVPGGVDDADVRFTFQLIDVREQGTLADYTDELQVASVVRITDRLGGSANETGTVTDIEHKLTVPCAATGDTVGATCSATTTFDAVVPGTIKEGKRAIWQLEGVRVNDGGPDGLASTTPNTLFAVQGVFVP